jgi:hypothetical protein
VLNSARVVLLATRLKLLLSSAPPAAEPLALQPGNKTFPKKQSLHYMVGYKQEASQEPILCAEEPSDVIKAARPAPSTLCAAAPPSTLPQWIEHDRKVLRFYGFYQEHVTEDVTENARYRKVVFFYHLEDDTMQVSEPKQDNSGLSQVCLSCQSGIKCLRRCFC